MSENEISKSKQKRMAIEKARKDQKKKKALVIMWCILIPLLIVGVIGGIVYYNKASQLNYSKYLNADGTIAVDSIDNYVSLDYKGMTFSKSELMPDDATIESDINAMLDNYKYISQDASLKSQDGDRVNICYTSTLGGVSYNSVTEETGGADITIGSNLISEDFDQALIGHKMGDEFPVEVSYAADYEDATLAGQTVKYEVTFNGVYVTPELDDAFVAENLPEYESAQAYRQSLVDNYYEQNLRSAISSYVKEHAVISQVPDKFVENLAKIYDVLNQQQFEYYNQLYMSYLGYALYNNVYEMCGYSTQEEYDAFVHQMAVEDTQYTLALQYIYEHENLSNTAEGVQISFYANGYDETSYAQAISDYGMNYMAYTVLPELVEDYLYDTVIITE